MNGMPACQPLTPDADAILQELSTRQFVRPHCPLSDALSDAAARLGFCDAAAVRAVAWLELDPGTAIGRLKRTELAQLARSIHRFWQRGAAADHAAGPVVPAVTRGS